MVRYFMGGIELPFYREHCRPQPGRMPAIEICGVGMRVGKTTLLEALSEGLASKGLPVEKSYEEYKLNPHLELSYDPLDPVAKSKAILNNQKWFVGHKREQLSRPNGQVIHIQEVSPEMDWSYATASYLLDRLSQEDYQEYLGFYRELNWHEVPAPDLYVYVAASEDVYLNRVRASLRQFEEQVEFDADYYLTLRGVNQHWLQQAKLKKRNVLVVDSDNLNFAMPGEERDRVVELVLKEIL